MSTNRRKIRELACGYWWGGEPFIEQTLKMHVYLMCPNISEEAGVAAAE